VSATSGACEGSADVEDHEPERVDVVLLGDVLPKEVGVAAVTEDLLLEHRDVFPAILVEMPRRRFLADPAPILDDLLLLTMRETWRQGLRAR
jgi:hypothetical protein